jgi:tripartite-type tricarboxylate transporter receptor subunit TctC
VSAVSCSHAIRAAVVALVLVAGAITTAYPQPYPARALKLIVPFPPGGADVLARLMADRLSASLGQPVIVENRAGGGGGTVGTKAVATAEPDGHTLLFTSPGPLTTGAAVYRNLDYDPIRSFAPVVIVATSPVLLAVHPDVPARTIAELIAYARSHPGRLSYASVGHGSLPHLFGELLRQRAGIEIVHVPYRGSGPAITDLLAGQVHMLIDNTRNLVPFVRAGRVRALAVTSESRAPEYPDLPTMPESGYPEFLATYWNGMLAPAGTPVAIVNELNAIINSSLSTPEMQSSVSKLGMVPRGGSPQAFAALIAHELQKWTAVAHAADIKVDR